VSRAPSLGLTMPSLIDAVALTTQIHIKTSEKPGSKHIMINTKYRLNLTKRDKLNKRKLQRSLRRKGEQR